MSDRIVTDLTTKLNDNTRRLRFGRGIVEVQVKDFSGWDTVDKIYCPRADEAYDAVIGQLHPDSDGVRVVFKEDAGRDDWGETKYRTVATTQVTGRNITKAMKDHNDAFKALGL